MTAPTLELIKRRNAARLGSSIETPEESKPARLSELSIQQIMDLQKGDLFAVGRYQFIPETLQSAVKKAGLDTNQKFTPATQDKIFDSYLLSKRPAIERYFNGSGSIEDAQIALAKEFASVPLPHDVVVNGKVKKKGQSYYAGDSAGNAAQMSIEDVQKALQTKDLSALRNLIGSGEGDYDSLNRGKAGDTSIGSADYLAAIGGRGFRSEPEGPSTTDLIAARNKSKPQTPASSLVNTLRNFAKILYMGTDEGARDLVMRKEFLDAFEAAKPISSIPADFRVLGGRIADVFNFLGGDKQEKSDSKANIDFGEILKNLPAAIPAGMLSIVTAPISTITGIGLDRPELYGLSPEERVQQGLDAVANFAAIGTGIGVHRTIASSAAKSITGTKTIVEALQAGEKIAGGALKRTIITGAAEGLAAGTVQAGISSIGDMDMFAQQAITNTVFAPIGIMFERLGYLGKSTDAVGEAALRQGYDVAQARMIQITENKNLFDVAASISGLETADDIFEAALKAKIGAEVFVVPGVHMTPERVLQIAKDYPNKPYRLHDRGDGTFDVLMGDRNLHPAAQNMFEQTGFLPEEVVSYKGKNYLFSAAVSKVIEPPPIAQATVSSGERRLPRNAIENALFAMRGEALDNAIFNYQQIVDQFPTGKDYQYRLEMLKQVKELDDILPDVETPPVVISPAMADIVSKISIEEINPLIKRITESEQLNNLDAETRAQVDEFVSQLQQKRLGVKQPESKAPSIFNYELPTRLARSSPRYKKHQVIFEDDLARAAYILQDPKKSKAHSVFLADVMAKTGLSEEAIVKFGREVKAQLKLQERKARNADDVLVVKSRRAPVFEPPEVVAPKTTSTKAPKVVTVANLTDPTNTNHRIAVPLNEVMRHPELNRLNITPENVGRFIFDDFARYTMKLSDEAADVTAAFLDSESPKSFSDLVEEYGKLRGYPRRELPRLEGDLLNGIRKALENDPEAAKELADLPSRYNEEANLTEKLRGEHVASIKDLHEAVTANGMFIAEGDDITAFAIRDAFHHKVIQRFNKIEDALKWIKETGQEQKGTDLVDGLSKLGSGRAPLPDEKTIYANRAQFSPMVTSGRFGGKWLIDISDVINIKTPWGTHVSNFAQSLDNRYGTQVHAKVVEPLLKARIHYEGQVTPWLKKVQKISLIDSKLKAEDLWRIGEAVETASPESIRKFGGIGKKALSPEEIALGERAAELGVDMPNIDKYLRNERRLHRLYEGDELIVATQALQEQLGIKKNELEVIDGLRKLSKIPGSFGNVTRLVDAIQYKKLDRPEFMDFHNFTPKQRKIVQQIDDLYKELADAFGIPDAERLQFFVTHAQKFGDGDFERTLKRLGVPDQARDFYARLARTGEITGYERNPITALQRYIRAWGNATFFEPELVRVKKVFQEELSKIPIEQGGPRKATEETITSFFDRVRGFPGIERQATEQIVNMLFKERGSNVNVNVKGIVDGILLLFDTAFQGARLHQGIRDFGQMAKMIDSRFDMRTLSRVIEYGKKGLDNVTRQNLEGAGTIPQLNVIAIETASEATISGIESAASKLQRANRRAAEVGFKLSGQKDVYSIMAAGVYMERFEFVGNQLKFLARDQADKIKTYKKIKLQKYEQATQRYFDELVSQDKYEEATRFLARQTVRETVGLYGHGNGPGWTNRNIGRMFGQYGTWWRWNIQSLQQNLTRGTWRDRAMFAIKYAAWDSAILATGAALGLNLWSWTTLQSVFYAFSPMYQSIVTVGKAFGGYGIEKDLAQRELKAYLPWDFEYDEPALFPNAQFFDPETGKPDLGTKMVPGSYLLNDVVNAFWEAQQGSSPLQVGARAIGFKVKEEED